MDYQRFQAAALAGILAALILIMLSLAPALAPDMERGASISLVMAAFLAGAYLLYIVCAGIAKIK